jgi:hypothetical protein
MRFDAAIVAAPPDRLRLRAWKLGRAVFDMTLTPDGVWLLTPDDPSIREKVRSASHGTGEFARQWSLLSGAFFDRQDLVITRLPRDLLFTAPQGDLLLRCDVDPRTLVPCLYTLQDQQGKVHFTLNLDSYALINSIPTARRLQAESAQGRIVVQLDEIELNGELAPAAFVPPRRAEKLP